MGTNLWTPRGRNLLALAIAAGLGATGMGASRVPVLGYVDVGTHEAGHLLSHLLAVGDVGTWAAGSIAQVAVPLLLAAYFLLAHPDRVGSSICLAWTATAAADVGRHVADAPTRALPLVTGEHDWALILGPHGWDDLGRAPELASTITSGAWMLLVVAVALPVWELVKGRRPGGRRRRARRPAATDLDLRQRVDLRSPGDAGLDLRQVPKSTVGRTKAPKAPVAATRDGRRPPTI